MNPEEIKKEKILNKVKKWHDKCNKEYSVQIEFDKGCIEKAIDLSFLAGQKETTEKKDTEIKEKVEKLKERFEGCETTLEIIDKIFKENLLEENQEENKKERGK
jgi:hypothetical protein